ncbi:MAG: flagellar hook protein FlgE [Burkholderiales bacterium]|nr:flagellar hook protein FlgE [Burkholderiales bacterium]
MSFQQGLSGLNTSSKNLEVIGNNIANANTFGSKASRAEFADMYAGMLNATGGSDVGMGTQIAAITQQFSQGAITATENSMDVAINGAGFFQVHDPSGSLLYTRNGQFKVDRDGYVVNNQGDKLLGYMADANGNVVQGAATELKLPTAGISPQATADVTMEMNLDSRATVITPPATGPQIDFDDPKTYTSATSMTAYDAKGQEVPLTVYYQKSAADTWDVYITANGAPISGTAAAPTPSTTITYPTNGAAPSAPAGPVTLSIPATTDANGNVTSVAIDPVTFDLSKSTQYGASFAITNLSQDGRAPGQLNSISIDPNGTIMARYSNGKTLAAGQVELATFRNPQGLQPLGGNAWASSFASGDPIVGAPKSGTMGQLQSGALEESNVDLTSELVNMITAQRVYQANAQTIKTQDAILQTLVNLR